MGLSLEQINMLEPTDGELWAHARKDYEAGISVGEICGRYGLARATVYQRAQVWRAAGGAVDLTEPKPKAADLAEIAWRRLAFAVEAGRLQEALCWRKLTETLEARAEKEAWAEKARGLMEDEASDALVADREGEAADKEAIRAASLDTPLAPAAPPAPVFESSDDADDEPFSPEQVREWRAWAAYSERHLREDAAETGAETETETGEGGGLESPGGTAGGVGDAPERAGGPGP